MSLELSAQRGAASAWLERAVFSLDRILRWRLGVYEFSTRPECVFRIGTGHAEQSWKLPEGTEIRAGDDIIELHLWNEHMPAMGPHGPTVAWARQVNRAIASSLSELARYIEQRPELHQVVAICGDMHLGSKQRRAQLERIVARYGFLTVETCARPGALHRLGKTILIILLVLATNPAALRNTILRRYHTRLLLPRSALARFKFDAAAPARSRSPGV